MTIEDKVKDLKENFMVFLSDFARGKAMVKLNETEVKVATACLRGEIDEETINNTLISLINEMDDRPDEVDILQALSLV